MVASDRTVEALYELLLRHCTKQQANAIMRDLAKVAGNRSFAATIRKLIALHQEKSDG